MNDDVIGATVEGARSLKDALMGIADDGDAATLAAVKASANLMKSRVRSRLRGKPRWSHRGASSRTGAAVDLGGPAHSPRSGGPGRFTGQLAQSVRSSRRPRRTAEGYDTAVFMGGRKTPVTNLYKGRQEKKYPYFAPGIKTAEPQIAVVWEKAWKRVIDRRAR